MLDIKNRLLFAIPKKGRLNEKATNLLKKIDLKYHRKDRLDIALCSNFPIAILFLPAKDVALYVGEGKVDMGITGQDVVQESNVDVKELLQLNFGKCQLCVQAPELNNLTVSNIADKRVVTSFPRITKFFFDKKFPGHKTEIKTVSGSVEIACSLGLADAVVDLVESGETMRASGLSIVEQIMSTEAVLVSNLHSPHRELIRKLEHRFQGVITAQKYAMIEYNISRLNLPLGEKLTPGRKSPTISPLEDKEWVAVKSLVDKNDINFLSDELEKIGAVDILIYGIDNCRV